MATDLQVRGPALCGSRRFLALLHSPDDASGRAIRDHAKHRVIRKGEVLILQGDPSANVFFIEEGRILACRYNQNGREIAIGCLGPGDVCGLEDALSEDAYGACHLVLSAGVVWRLAAADLRRLLDDVPMLAHVVMGYLARRTRDAEEHLETLALDDLSTRIRKMLARLALQVGLSDGPVLLPITQGHLAALVGASRQRTNAALVRLSRMGIVDSRAKRIMLLDPSALHSR